MANFSYILLFLPLNFTFRHFKGVFRFKKRHYFIELNKIQLFTLISLIKKKIKSHNKFKIFN